MDLITHFLFVTIPKAICILLCLHFTVVSFGVFMGLNPNQRRLAQALTPAERKKTLKSVKVGRKSLSQMLTLAAVFGVVAVLIH